MRSKAIKTAFLFLLILVVVSACRKDKLITDPSANITLTTDTLTFDTVFTSIGSTTKFFKLINDNKQKISVSNIFLAGGAQSQFRMNIDGSPSVSAQNVEIRGKDSLYVFVEVTIDPTIASQPFVIEDSIMIEVNGNRSSVLLVAWGQNALYFNSNIICDMKWLKDKPYVIYNSVLVDSNCTLTIKEGTNIYFHANSRLFVNGTLKVNGTQSDAVTFQGDRLELFYEDLPGQWEGIHILRPSTNNVIEYAVIKNSIVGIRVDSLSENNNPKLILKNTIIQNMLASGILGLTAEIEAENCLIFNCGQYNVQLELGGVYTFKHCTFANFSTAVISHRNSLVRLGNFIELAPANLTDHMNATFTNCIIYGGLDEELDFGFDNVSDSIYLFEKCIIKTERDLNVSEFISIKKNKDPEYMDIEKDDYHISSASPAKNAGKNLGIMIDLEGNPRSDGKPDMGCYEEGN